MAENLNEDVAESPWEQARQRAGKNFVILTLCLLAALAALVGVFWMMPGNRAVLHEDDFYCSKPTATSRFRFDRPATCDQYTRKVEPSRWNR